MNRKYLISCSREESVQRVLSALDDAMTKANL
jgi:hypothetical protein